MNWPIDYVDQVICGDCLDVLPALPDNSMDAIITDPPYGIKGEESFDIVIKAMSLVNYKCAAIITDWRNSISLSALPDKVGELVWEYGWVSGGRTRATYGIMPTHNTIHLFGDISRFHFLTGTIIRRGPGLSSPRQCSYAKKSGHPYEKPLGLMRYLLQHIDADLILDPFMGSGTTALAAKMEGRHYIGIEKDAGYVEIARRRLGAILL